MYIQYTCIYSYVYRYIKGGINNASNDVRHPCFHFLSLVRQLTPWTHANMPQAIYSREVCNLMCGTQWLNYQCYFLSAVCKL